MNLKESLCLFLISSFIVSCNINKAPETAADGGNTIKLNAEVLNLFNDSTALVLITNILQRNSDPLSQSIMKGDTVDLFFSFGHEGYYFTGQDNQKYKYPKVHIGDAIQSTLVILPQLNSSKPLNKVVWYKKQ